MSQSSLFAYLDHNILDSMSKGDPYGVGNLLERASLTAVFSDENLAEIRRSRGYEEAFLEVLERIGARYLVPILDEQCKPTGSAEVREVKPRDAYHRSLENVASTPGSDFGLSSMLQKLYGGRQDQSFEEIFERGTDELQNLLITLREKIVKVPEIDDRARAEFENAVSRIPELLRQQYCSVASQLDAEPLAAVKQFEEATELGPKVLKNIQGPGVVRKIWALLEDRLGGAEIDMEVFFGIRPFPFEADPARERTIVEKVNGIYHQLNFLGYYRDSKMSRQRQFTASVSDMTHAGLATFCHLLICRDEDLAMKAAAAYEHPGIGTRILHYGANK